MGGWHEEVYYSLYMIGLCKQNDGLDFENEILYDYRDIHTFKFKDELAICAYWISDHTLANELNNELLNLDCLNNNYRNRIQKNLNFSARASRTELGTFNFEFCAPLSGFFKHF